jgi:hypothetical protein
MAKRQNLSTRAFGAEPGLPEVSLLAAWVAGNRGRMADITTYRLDRSLAPQVDAGIQVPCAGGKFYADRIRECIAGLSGSRATGEIHAETAALAEDAAGIVVQKKGAWCALPAPLSLGLADAYFEDRAEWTDALCETYRTMMRAMRDFGVAGHVLIAGTMDSAELASLSWQKVFFFQAGLPTRKDFETLLEYQQQVAAGRESLELLFDITGEYTLRKLFLLDPDPASVDMALSHLDPDQLVCGGYCTDACGDYWTNLVAAAGFER